ncbi:hypothetical protein K1719_027428 [Acacia pycnantha]|nr:hypothetical protein K1719_027428 [Acacia pycnantha]
MLQVLIPIPFILRSSSSSHLVDSVLNYHFHTDLENWRPNDVPNATWVARCSRAMLRRLLCMTTPAVGLCTMRGCGDAIMARWLQSAGLQHLASPLASTSIDHRLLPNLLIYLGYLSALG